MASHYPGLPDDILAPKPMVDRAGKSLSATPVYDHIPQLEEMLPKYRGQPGFVYAQIPAQLRIRAREEGWFDLDTPYLYVIEGPDGEANMHLLTRGSHIPGQSPDSGARLCVVDEMVEDLTGHLIPRLDKSDLASPEKKPATKGK